MDVGDGEDLGGGVDQDRHLLLARHGGDRLGAERAGIRVRAGEDVDHRRPRAECRLELFGRAHFDDAHADGADGRVVDVARMPRDDDFVFREPAQVRNPHVEIGIAARDAGGGRVGQARRTAGRDHAPFRLRQFREPRADRRHQLVEVHVLLRGRVDGRADLRQHERAADDGERAARVDQRAHADRLVDVLARAKLRRRARLRGARGSRGVAVEGTRAAVSRADRRNSSRRLTVPMSEHRDDVDLDQRVARNAALRRDGRPHRGSAPKRPRNISFIPA